MKLTLAVVFSVLALLGQANAWAWFSRSNNAEDEMDDTATVAAAADVTQTCLNQASWGTCAFYDCLEARFPMGAQGYNTRVSKHFCNKIDQNYNSFDTFGRRWLNQTSICLVGYMLPIYRDHASTSNGALKAAGIEAIINCNEGTVDSQNFCDFLNTNGDAYKALMGSHEARLLVSLGDRRVFQSMISNTLSCGMESFRGFVTSTTQRVANIMGSIWSSIFG